MACKKLTHREVIELIFGDSDSEGENLTLGDDGRSISELASRGASLFSNGAAARTEENAQALTHIGGNGNDTQTCSISREANGCGRSSGDGENSAGTSVSVHSFYRDGHVASIHGSGAAMRRSSVHEACSGLT